jgi:hypothetical protein
MAGLFRRKSSNPAGDSSHDTADDTCQIASVSPRGVVKVRGQVTRIRQRPANGLPSLVVTISDESGRATAVWSGRRSIGGIGLGRTLLIEGVASETADGLTFLNPSYVLLPASGH